MTPTEWKIVKFARPTPHGTGGLARSTVLPGTLPGIFWLRVGGHRDLWVADLGKDVHPDGAVHSASMNLEWATPLFPVQERSERATIIERSGSV